MTAKRYPASHYRAKAIIKACAAVGAEIIALEDAPNFRFVPATDNAAAREAKDNHAKPSPRPSVSVKCRKRACPCHKSKWYRHRPIEAGADYFVPMAGDNSELEKARRAYHEGNPKLLRAYLAKLPKAEPEPVIPCPVQPILRVPSTLERWRHFGSLHKAA